METIALATNNEGKVKEYLSLLAPLGVKVIRPRDLGIEVDPKEDGNTYRENAAIKAKAIRPYTSLPILADDSGLEIDSLGNFPGLKTARFAKEQGGFPAVFSKVFSLLEGKRREARFVCCIAFIPENEDTPLFFEGICPGRILEEPVGLNGFGYDPIFFSEEINAPLGIAEESIKDKISHRGKACAKLLDYLLK